MRRIFRGLVALFLSSLLCLLIAELGLRSWLDAPLLAPIWRVSADYRSDPRCDYTLEPLQESWVLGGAGLGLLETDRDGFIGRAAGDGDKEILLLGDSFFEAAQVGFSEHIASRLAAELSERQKSARVRCLAASGWSPENEWRRLSQLPDSTLAPVKTIVLGFFIGNDIIEVGDTEGEPRLFAYLDGDSLAWKNSPMPEPRKEAFTSPFILPKFIHFKWPFLLEKFSRPSPATGTAGDSTLARTAPGPWAPLRKIMTVYLRTPDPETERRWRITEKILLEMARFSREHGARFVALIIPERRELFDENWRMTLEALETTDAFYDRHAPRLRLKEFCERSGIESTDIYDAMKERPELFLAGDGHWSAEGHALAAEVLAKTL